MNKNLFSINAFPLIAAVATILGMAFYFALPVEPSVTIGIIMSIVSIIFTVFFRSNYIKTLIGIGFIFFSVSFSYAIFYSNNINTTFLPVSYDNKQVWVRGKIIDVWPSKKRTSLELKHVKIYGLDKNKTPEIIKISLDNKRANNYSVGHWVAAQVILHPPQVSQFKGDYNRQKADYFNGIGARGYVRGSIYSTWVPNAERYNTLDVKIQRIRSKVSQLIMGDSTSQASAIASALLTGIKGNIAPEVYDSFRYSGLAHLLAISGLHLALFGGFIFVLIRRLLCLYPPLVLKYSSKKMAAVGALIGTFAYMLLAGGTIPTMRAFIMIALLFIGILFSRIKISLRSLCVAVIVILFIYPESILTVSFQMSFVAVFALIIWNNYHEKQAKSRLKLVTFIDYIKATALTALIAGLATMPIAAFHFQEISIGGFIANIIAVPLTALWIMPSGLFVLLLMPFGAYHTAQKIMEEGINILINIAQTVSSYSWSHFDVGIDMLGYIIIIVITALFIIFYKEHWKKIISLSLICLFIIMLMPSTKPTIVWLAGGDIVLLNTDKGIQQVYVEKNNSKSKRLLASYIRKQKATLITKKPDRCDSIGCIFFINNTQVLALENGMLPSEEDCRVNDIILPLKMKTYCGENYTKPKPYIYALGWLKNGSLYQKFYTVKQARIWQ